MGKLIVLVIVCAFCFGVITYEDEKVTIDTTKARIVADEMKTCLDEHVEVK